MSQKPVDAATQAAIRQFESAALNFAYQAINIAQVRSEYIRRAQEVSASLRTAYRTGEMSAKAAAEAAHGMRNKLLEVQRARSAAVGRALAKNLKAKGLDLDIILEKLANRIFDRRFTELDNVQQTRVFMEVVESAGRARPSATRFAARAGAAGRAMFLIGIGIAAYNIANAQDKAWQTGREASSIMGGLGGSIAAGALAGVWLGPVGVAVGAFVGGVAGALLADHAYVETVGASDRQAGAFIKRFTTFFGTDEQGLANALHDDVGMDGDRAHAIFLAMDESYNTDADDVAVLYLERVFARQGLALQALQLNRSLRETLIRILDEGWTSSKEAALISRLRAIR